MDDFSYIDFDRQFELTNAYVAMKTYCKKLVSGEKMICQSNRYKNLFLASQLSKMVQKFEQTLECIEYHRDYSDARAPHFLLNNSDEDWWLPQWNERMGI